MRRRIKKARVEFVSLVPRGANQFPVLYKEEGNKVEIETLSKMNEEKGELLSVVYAPGIEDSQGDFADAETIKDMAYEAGRNGLKLDVRHNGKPLTKEQAYVAESFIVQKGDPRFAGFKDYNDNEVDVTDAWAMVIKIDDPELRKAYSEGGWQGVSLAGTGQVEVEKADPSSILQKLIKLLGLKNVYARQHLSLDGEIDMTPEELNKALEKQAETISKSFADSITTLVKELKKSDTDEKAKAEAEAKAKAEALQKQQAETLSLDEPPVFKGNPTDLQALKKHQAALVAYENASQVDFTDPAQVAEYIEKMEQAKQPLSRRRPSGDDDTNLQKEAASRMVGYINGPSKKTA